MVPLVPYRAGDTTGSSVHFDERAASMDPSSLDHAHREVQLRLQLVSPAVVLPTPCEGWSVRDLVEHMAVGATMSCQLLSGETWTREAVVETVSSAPAPRQSEKGSSVQVRHSHRVFYAKRSVVRWPTASCIFAIRSQWGLARGVAPDRIRRTLDFERLSFPVRGSGTDTGSGLFDRDALSGIP